MRMMKQDRQGARTPAQLEQKWDVGGKIAEVSTLAEEAKQAAEAAQNSAAESAKKLTHEEVFNLLTDNGNQQGLYKDENGNVYINASYIKSGELLADLIKSGRVSSKDGKAYFDLDSGFIAIDGETDSVTGKSIGLRFKESSVYGITVGESVNEIFRIYFDRSRIEFCDGMLIPSGAQMRIYASGGLSLGKAGQPMQVLGKTVSWKDNGDGTFTLTAT